MTTRDWRIPLLVIAATLICGVLFFSVVSPTSQANDHTVKTWYDEKETYDNQTDGSRIGCPWSSCAHVHNESQDPSGQWVYYNNARKGTSCPFPDGCVSHTHNYIKYHDQLYYWSLDPDNITDYSESERDQMGANEQFARQTDVTWKDPGAIADWNDRNHDRFTGNTDTSISIYPVNTTLHNNSRIRDAYVEMHSLQPRTTVAMGNPASCGYFGWWCESGYDYILKDTEVNLMYDYRIYAPDNATSDDPPVPSQPPRDAPLTFADDSDPSDSRKDDLVVKRHIEMNKARWLNVTYTNDSGGPYRAIARPNVTDHAVQLDPLNHPLRPVFRGDGIDVRAHAKIKTKVKSNRWTQHEWCEEHPKPYDNPYPPASDNITNIPSGPDYDRENCDSNRIEWGWDEEHTTSAGHSCGPPSPSGTGVSTSNCHDKTFHDTHEHCDYGDIDNDSVPEEHDCSWENHYKWDYTEHNHQEAIDCPSSSCNHHHDGPNVFVHWHETWTVDVEWDNNSIHVHDEITGDYNGLTVYDFDTNVKYTHVSPTKTQIYINSSPPAEGLMPVWNDVELPGSERGFTSFRYVSTRKPWWDQINVSSNDGGTGEITGVDLGKYRDFERRRTTAQAKPFSRWYYHSTIRPTRMYAFPANDTSVVEAGGQGGINVIAKERSATARNPPWLFGAGSFNISIQPDTYRTTRELVVQTRRTNLNYNYNPVRDRGSISQITVNGIVEGHTGNVTDLEYVETHRPKIKIINVNRTPSLNRSKYRIRVIDPVTGNPVHTGADGRGHVTVTHKYYTYEQRPINGSSGTKKVIVNHQFTDTYNTSSDGNITYTVHNYTNTTELVVKYHPSEWWEPLNPSNPALNTDTRFTSTTQTHSISPAPLTGSLRIIFRLITALVIPLFLGAIIFCLLDNIMPMSLWPFSDGECSWMPTLYE